MCGEQSAGEVIWQTNVGSPPRVRGTDGYMLHMSRKERITPACAGNRNGKSTIGCGRWDHPRVCGEQAQGGLGVEENGGSPPRVRGTEIPALVHRLVKRITPACAGNRRPLRTLLLPSRDHPRVCGEQTLSPS